MGVDDTTGDVYIADTHANGVSVVSGLPASSGEAIAGPGSGTNAPLPESPLTIGLPVGALAALVLAFSAAFVIRRRRSPAQA